MKGKKKKLIVTITNRSSYNKVKTILKNLPAGVEPVLLLGNSIYLYKYGYAYQNIKNDFPDLKILKTSLAVEGDCLSKMPKTVGMGLIELSTLIDNEHPDMVLTVADRYETMATAIAAAYVNVPLVHLQGGELSGTIDDKVRNAITQLADYHFPATNDAADRIMQMKPKDHDRIWNFGCPSMDLLAESILNIKGHQEELNKHGVGDKIVLCDDYMIVMLHPDTTGDPVGAKQVRCVFEALDTFHHQKIVMWPNIDAGSDAISKAWRMSERKTWKSPVRYIRHLDSELFSVLLINCSCIVGNSSAGIREATFLNIPSVTIGDRQKDREHGYNVMRVPFHEKAIRDAVERQMNIKFPFNDMYGDGNAGKKIGAQLGRILNAK